MNIFRGRRQGKIDKKFFVFGEEPEENETAYLLGRIKHLLRETNISLLFDGEVILTYLCSPFVQCRSPCNKFINLIVKII